MSGASHTPGPWEIGNPERGDHRFYVYCDNALGTAVAATVFEHDMTGWPEATRLANARLIAAAPELLEALEIAAERECSSWCAESVGEHTKACKRNRTAIAKARGAQ